MSTIWGVSSGMGEDHGVEAIFTSKEKARVYLDKFKALQYDAELQEFVLDPEPPEPVELIDIQIFKDGLVWEGYTRMCRLGQLGFRRYFDNGAMVWLVRPDFIKGMRKENTAAMREAILDAGAWGDTDATRKVLDDDALSLSLWWAQ